MSDFKVKWQDGLSGRVDHWWHFCLVSGLFLRRVPMLKHCSPSAVDLKRRSRRSLEVDEGHHSNNEDAMSLQSCSASSSTSSTTSTSHDSGAIISNNGSSLIHTSSLDTSSDNGFRDVATSPRVSPVTSPKRARHFEQRRKLLPLALIAKYNTDNNQQVGKVWLIFCFWPTRPLGQIGGHYFHRWCPSVRPENKNTPKTWLWPKQKHVTMLHGGLVGHFEVPWLVPGYVE